MRITQHEYKLEPGKLENQKLLYGPPIILHKVDQEVVLLYIIFTRITVSILPVTLFHSVTLEFVVFKLTG